MSRVQEKLTDFAHGHKIDLDAPKLSSVVRARKAKTVCKGLSGVGIVVPYVKKTELGYRPLQKSDKDLETLFRQYKDPSVDTKGKLKIKSILEEVSTWVTIAIDESDFGTGLEFGLDLFGSGIEDLHSMTKCTLGVAYQSTRHIFWCDVKECCPAFLLSCLHREFCPSVEHTGRISLVVVKRLIWRTEMWIM
ncbi:hypothetical protein M8J75_008626 [Diaphorina citri]|nr:hypothetical protein M8J75_008626 [Diaphorina citri]